MLTLSGGMRWREGGGIYHGLLITKSQHIDYKKYSDGIYGSKDVIRGFQKM